MSDHSKQSTVDSSRFSSLSKLLGVTLLSGFAMSLGFYVYNTYVITEEPTEESNEEVNESNEESDI